MRKIFIVASLAFAAVVTTGQTPEAASLDAAAEAVERAGDAATAQRAIRFHLPGDADKTLQDIRGTLSRAKDRATVERREAAAALRRLARAAAYAPTTGAAKTVEEIKSNSAYREGPKDAKSNWLARAIQALLDWLNKLLHLDDRQSSSSAPDLSAPRLPAWITSVIWVLLAAIVMAAAIPLILLLTKRLRRTARKKKGGLLGDEPERTKDEYLALADRLAVKGEHREAIRMLYLATLKRFDEARVARFDRGETNWEHLARIEASPKLPKGLDFRPATRAFDYHWYGDLPAGAAEYAQFQAWYGEVERRLREGPAASGTGEES